VNAKAADTIHNVASASHPNWSKERRARADKSANGEDSGSGLVIESGSGGPVGVTHHVEPKTVRDRLSGETLTELATAVKRLERA
jgi:hypothetical protein